VRTWYVPVPSHFHLNPLIRGRIVGHGACQIIMMSQARIDENLVSPAGV
jgi:hypothetical protein